MKIQPSRYATESPGTGLPSPPAALKPSRWEYLLPGFAVCAILFHCVTVSAKKFFWNDELFSYYMTSEASYDKMLIAFHDKLNNTPFLYFFLGWNWDKLFGSSELSLRLFTSLGMCIALAIAWVVIRRTFHFWPTALGVSLVFCTSNLILIQNGEARMYGLFLAVSAVCLLLYARLYQKRHAGLGMLLLNACAHAALVHTHLFGLFYGAGVLLAFVIVDRLLRMFRPWLYASIVLGWLSLVFYMPAFLVQADAGKPRTWIPAPDLRDLIDIYGITAQSFASRTLLVVFALIVSVFIYQYKKPGVSSYFSRYRPQAAEIPLLVFAAVFLLVPVGVWVVSLTIKPVFYPRYMLPSALGWAILLTYIASRNTAHALFTEDIQSFFKRQKPLAGAFVSLALVLLVAAALVRPVLVGINFRGKLRPGSRDLRKSILRKYGQLPRVVTLSGDFLERNYYSPDRRQYYYILDWKSAVAPSSGTFPPQEFKHMQAWRRNFPARFERNILTNDEFLSRYDRFLVIDRPNYLAQCQPNHHGLHTHNLWDDYLECPQWVEMRLLANPAYRVTPLENFPWLAVLLVEKAGN
ncbi:hypothetical protein [Hymenobacter daeguensis]